MTYDGEVSDGNIPDSGLTFVGVTGIRDDVRPDAIKAIEQVHQAGVQVVMITGDRKETAQAIAKEAGLIEIDDAIVMTSAELNEMSDEEVKSKLKKIRVIARALPTDKSRLVRLAQEMNLVVGMTGDGVNDSPALKKADVGFAMGGGTEVAKEASEIVILDDNFKSIGKAILYGRTIFNSIRKFIIFQLTINVGAVLISFVCPLLGLENPLSIWRRWHSAESPRSTGTWRKSRRGATKKLSTNICTAQSGRAHCGVSRWAWSFCSRIFPATISAT